MLPGVAIALAVSTIVAGADSVPIQTPFTIPSGRSILIDGKVREQEWSDARVVPLDSGARLLLKHDDTYLYVAIVPAAPRLFGLNLYLAADERATQYVNLHASAKLAERVGHTNAWPEWQWWNNRDWSANVARFNAFDEPRFLPEEGKEVQIALTRLPGSRFLLTLDLEVPGAVARPLKGGLVADGLRWLAVELSHPPVPAFHRAAPVP